VCLAAQVAVGKIPAFDITLENSGQTPAGRLKVECRERAGVDGDAHKVTVTGFKRVTTSNWNIGAGGKCLLNMYLAVIFSVREMSLLESGEYRCVLGIIYSCDDPFGIKRRGVSRMTSFHNPLIKAKEWPLGMANRNNRSNWRCEDHFRHSHLACLLHKSASFFQEIWPLVPNRPVRCQSQNP
jgi:hypothetical protein